MATVQDKNRIHILQLDENSMSFYLNDSSETTKDAFAYGSEVKAIANTSQAFGKDTQAGCMGYQIEYITYDEKADTGAIYLTRKTEAIVPKNFIEGTSSGETDYFYSGYSIPKDEYGNKTGNLICHVQSNGYYQWPYIEITAISGEVENGGVLTYKTSSIQSGKQYWAQTHTDGRVPQPFILYCADYPMAGVIPVGANAHAEGSETLAAADDSHAEGCGTRTAGRYAHAEGKNTEAGFCAHSEGYETQAKGFYSHAEGCETIAAGQSSHAEGYESIASGNQAHSEGYSTQALGTQSHSEGYNTKAEGNQSHAEGINTEAIGTAAHAEGSTTVANGRQSHTEGVGTKATTRAQHVQGKYNTIDSPSDNYEGYAHIVGNGSSDKNRSNAHTLDWDGNAWYSGTVRAKQSTIPAEDELITKKYFDTNFPNTDDAVGEKTTKGEIFNAYPGKDKEPNTAEGNKAHAEGLGTEAKGNISHAEGYQTKATNSQAHAEGYNTTASGAQSHAQGSTTTASGSMSHAEGYDTTASGSMSHAEGQATLATRKAQHVQGKYNIEDSEFLSDGDKANSDESRYGKYAHIVGNGYYDSKADAPVRSNAHTLDWKGNAWYKGRIQCGGTKWDDDVIGRVPCVFEGVTEPDKITGSYNNGDFYIYKTQNSSAGKPETITLDTDQMYTAYSANTKWINNNDQTLYLGFTISPNSWWYGKIQFTAPDFLPTGTKITFNLPGIKNSSISGAISTIDITYTSIKEYWTSSFSADAFISELTSMSNNSSQIQITLTQNIAKNTSLYFYVGFTENGNTKGASTSFSSITASYALPSGLITTAGVYIRILDTWLKLNETSITAPS